MATPRIRIIDGSTGPAAFPSPASPAVAGSSPVAPFVPAPPAGAPTGPPAPALASAFGDPIPVTIVSPRPLPVVAEGFGGAGGGGPGRRPTTGKRPKGPTRVQRIGARARAITQSAGVATAGLAGNAGMPGFAVAMEGATRGLDSLGRAGQITAAGLGVLGDGFKGAIATIDAFANRGRELSGLSPELAAASARADLTRLQADLREAQDLGPQMAQLIESQAKAEATMREIWMPIKGFLLDALNAFLESLLEIGKGGLEGINDLLDFFDEKSDKITKIIKRIEDILSGGGAAAIDPLEGWLRATEKWVAPAAAGEPPPAAAPGGGGLGLGIPLLGDLPR